MKEIRFSFDDDDRTENNEDIDMSEYKEYIRDLSVSPMTKRTREMRNSLRKNLVPIRSRKTLTRTASLTKTRKTAIAAGRRLRGDRAAPTQKAKENQPRRQKKARRKDCGRSSRRCRHRRGVFGVSCFCRKKY